MRPRTTHSVLAYEEVGDGPPVVLLHGLTFDRTTWRPIIGRLTDFRAVAVDLPGHGETGGPGCSVEEATARVGELVDQLGLERPVIVGHSMSVGIALMHALQRDVAGVVIVDSLPDIRAIGRLLHQLAPALRGPAFDAVFARFQETMGFEHLDASTRAEVLATQRIDREVVLAYWKTLIETDPDEYQAVIDAGLATLDTPCLAVFGHTLADTERELLRGLVRDVELEEWAGRGHFVHLAECERFATRLRSFASAATRCQDVHLPSDQ